MNPLTFIGDIFRAVTAIFGFGQKKLELNNTPEMQKRSEAQKETNQDDIDAKILKDGDVDDLRNRSS